MSRTYSDREGSIPLHRMRDDIDYGFTEAATASGNIGVKVWIYRGDVLPEVAAVEVGPGRPAAAPTDKPRRSWRRVGARRAEVEAASETEEASGVAPESEVASEEPVSESETPAVDEAASVADETVSVADETVSAADETVSDETTVDAAEEQDQDVDAVEGQVPETTEGPSER
jgi:hypothetical protein